MKHLLSKIASDLIKRSLHGDEEVKVEFTKYDDESVGILFWHYSERYKDNCSFIDFEEFHHDEDLESKFRLAKDVIAGETLINEKNSDLSY